MQSFLLKKKAQKKWIALIRWFCSTKTMQKREIPLSLYTYAKRPLRSLLLMIEVFKRNSPSLCHDFHVSRNKQNMYIYIYTYIWIFGQVAKISESLNFRGGDTSLRITTIWGKGIPTISQIYASFRSAFMAGMNVLGKSWAASIDQVFGEREREIGFPNSWSSCGANWEFTMGFAKLFFHSRRSGYKISWIFGPWVVWCFWCQSPMTQSG